MERVRVRNEDLRDAGPDPRESGEGVGERLEDVPPGGRPDVVGNRRQARFGLDPPKEIRCRKATEVELLFERAEEVRAQVLAWNAGGLRQSPQREARVEADEDVPEVDEKRPRRDVAAQRPALRTAAAAAGGRTGSPGMR